MDKDIEAFKRISDQHVMDNIHAMMDYFKRGIVSQLGLEDGYKCKVCGKQSTYEEIVQQTSTDIIWWSTEGTCYCPECYQIIGYFEVSRYHAWMFTRHEMIAYMQLDNENPELFEKMTDEEFKELLSDACGYEKLHGAGQIHDVDLSSEDVYCTICWYIDQMMGL